MNLSQKAAKKQTTKRHYCCRCFMNWTALCSFFRPRHRIGRMFTPFLPRIFAVAEHSATVDTVDRVRLPDTAWLSKMLQKGSVPREGSGSHSGVRNVRVWAMSTGLYVWVCVPRPSCRTWRVCVCVCVLEEEIERRKDRKRERESSRPVMQIQGHLASLLIGLPLLRRDVTPFFFRYHSATLTQW